MRVTHFDTGDAASAPSRTDLPMAGRVAATRSRRHDRTRYRPLPLDEAAHRGSPPFPPRYTDLSPMVCFRHASSDVRP
jgi:hypothetical protein